MSLPNVHAHVTTGLIVRRGRNPQETRLSYMPLQDTLRTMEAGGLSWIDVKGVWRIFVCTSVKQSSLRRCGVKVTMTRTIHNTLILWALVAASRPIALNKSEGFVRPITRVVVVIRKNCGKCIMSVAKKDVFKASSPIRIWANCHES